MSGSRRIGVGLIADKDVTVLGSLLQLLGPELDVNWSLTRDHDQADLVLIDVDFPSGAGVWDQFDRHQGLAAALTRRRDFQARLALYKPIRAKPLQRLLNRAVELDESPDLLAGIDTLQFDETGGILPLAEHLRRQVWMRPVSLSDDAQHELIIDAGAGVWYGRLSEVALAHLLQIRLHESEAVVLTTSELTDRVCDLQPQSLAALKWRAGLALGDGLLHPDLAGPARFMLTHVPHQALADTAWSRLARQLIEGPATLEALFFTTGVDAFDLAAFLNACHVCGLLILDHDQSNRG